MRIEDIVSNVNVYGLDESIKRAKYPMSADVSRLNNELTSGIKNLGSSPRGAGHDQFLTGIIVQFDLTLTTKAWVEAERYHFLDFVSSQSTMHRITRFDLDKSYVEFVDKRVVDIMKQLVKEYNNLVAAEAMSFVPQDVETTNKIAEEKRDKYLRILYTNPCGFRLTAGITTNYRQLKTIYSQRKDHRLPEWRLVCKWIESLPRFKEICLGE